MEVLEDRTVPSTLSGTVWEDINGDGVRDGGDVGKSGITVYVDQNQNGLRDGTESFATTNGSGDYSFTGLAAGTYYVVQELASNVAQTAPGPLTGPGLLGRVVHEVPTPQTVGDDPNNSPGLAWANGYLYAVHYNTSATSAPMYKIDPVTGSVIGGVITVPAGFHDLAFDGTNFWRNGGTRTIKKFDAAGTLLHTLDLSAVSSVGTIQSVEWAEGYLWISDSVNDKLHKVDPADGSLLQSLNAPDTSVRALAFDGRHLWVAGQDSDRNYEVDLSTGAVLRSFVYAGETLRQERHGTAAGEARGGLAFDGQYLWQHIFGFEEILKIDPGTTSAQAVNLDGVNDASGVDFGVFQLGTVSGLAFEDVNQNGARDGEGVTPGWRIYTDRNANGSFDGWEQFAVTNAAGTYALDSLTPGSHVVREDLDGALYNLPHWTQTAPGSASHTVSISVSAQAVSGRDFGNHLNRVDPLNTDWANAEGGRQNLYTGLAWFDESSGAGGITFGYEGAVATAEASQRGGYTDWRLPTKAEGQATAIEQLAGTQEFLHPPPFYYYWTSTATRRNVLGADVWLVQLANPAGTAAEGGFGTAFMAAVRDPATYIDDGAAGYTDTGWTLKSGGYQGDRRIRAAGTGSHTATWTFSGLEVGASYRVAVTWVASNKSATNAPFKVFDGAALENTLLINQKVAPNDFSVADVAWEGLGTYTISSGTLKVQLNNQANGEVVADAVRIFRVYPSFGSASPLVAAEGAAGDPVSEVIDQKQIAPLVSEALSRWQQIGVDVSILSAVDVRITDLGGATLGLASGNTIWLDDNAAGWGWYVDPTPWDAGESFLPGDQGEEGRMDLLTVLAHEIGHLLGLEHEEDGTMQETLGVGMREMPGVVPAVGHSAAYELAAIAEFANSKRR